MRFPGLPDWPMQPDESLPRPPDEPAGFLLPDVTAEAPPGREAIADPTATEGEGAAGPEDAIGSTEPTGLPWRDRSREPYWPIVITGGFVLTGVTVAGAAVEGPIGDFLEGGLQVLPFALLAFLAYLGIHRPWAFGLSIGWLAILLLGGGAFSMMMPLAGTTIGADSDGSDLARTAVALGVAGLFNLVGFTAAVVLLCPGPRRYAARFLPVDPDSRVHAVALSLVSGLTVMFLGQLIALGGRPVLLTLIQSDPEGLKETQESLVLSMVFGTVWILPGAWVACGWPLVRSFRNARERLGIVVPSRRQVLGAIGLALLLAGAVQLLSIGIDAGWKRLGWPTTDEEAFEKLLSGLITPFGAVIIGVTAGVGEEIAVRGLLQPRLGIVLSNLFFTALHSLQYAFDGLLVVFLVGMVLGVVRSRTNTTTSALVHGVYNFVLVMGSVVFAET